MRFPTDMYGIASELVAKKHKAEDEVVGLMLFDPPHTRRIAWAHGVDQFCFDDISQRIIYLAIDLCGQRGGNRVACLRIAKRALDEKWPGRFIEFHLAAKVSSECWRPFAADRVPNQLAAWCNQLVRLNKTINLASDCFNAAQRVLREGLTYRVSLPTGVAQLISEKPAVKNLCNEDQRAARSTGAKPRTYREKFCHLR